MQALKTLNVASAAAVAPRPAAVRRANAAAAPAASASAAASTSSSASSLRSAAPARRGLRSLPVASPQGNRSTTLARAAASSPPWAENDARLVLEDGSVWHGVAFGARASAVGEGGASCKVHAVNQGGAASGTRAVGKAGCGAQSCTAALCRAIV